MCNPVITIAKRYLIVLSPLMHIICQKLDAAWKFFRVGNHPSVFVPLLQVPPGDIDVRASPHDDIMIMTCHQ